MGRFAVVALLASCVAAFPNNIFERDPLPQTTATRCNRDNCLRAVVASNTPGGPARGSSDCSSFLATALVTPCAITNTFTTTLPFTTSVVTNTVTITLGSSTVVVSPTGTTTVVVTSPTTTTVLSTVTLPAKKVKAREAKFFDFLVARSLPPTSTCIWAASTNAPIKARSVVCSVLSTIVQPTGRSIPAYATSACTARNSADASARYSSACSCNGVTAGTSTLATSTTVSTVTTSTGVVGTTSSTVSITQGIQTITGGLSTVTSVVSSIVTILSTVTTVSSTTLPFCSPID